VHILLIEDDLEAARTLVKGLSESGYTSRIAKLRAVTALDALDPQ
jgi:DNA-binding response OmpR family regulator